MKPGARPSRPLDRRRGRSVSCAQARARAPCAAGRTGDHDGEARGEPRKVAARLHVAQQANERGALREAQQAVKRTLERPPAPRPYARPLCAGSARWPHAPRACAYTRVRGYLCAHDAFEESQRDVDVGVHGAVAVRAPPRLGLHCAVPPAGPRAPPSSLSRRDLGGGARGGERRYRRRRRRQSRRWWPDRRRWAR